MKRKARMTALVMGLALAAAPACREWFQSPSLPPEPPAQARFVHHVEVIYQRPRQVLCPDCGNSFRLCMDVWQPGNEKGYVTDCPLYDEWPEACCLDKDCKCRVEQIGPDTYRAYFDNVYVQRPGDPKHRAYVRDNRVWGHGCAVGHGITVRGAVDAEVKTLPLVYGCPGVDIREESFLLFRMPGD